MSFPERKPESLHGLELKVSLFLRWGVLTAGVLILLGWVLILQQGDSLAKIGVKEYNPVSLKESIEWAIIFKDRGVLICFFGLIALVTLPVIRVFLAGLLFIKQREFRMATMTFAVFFILLGSFFLGVEL